MSARLGTALAVALPVVVACVCVHASFRRAARAREQPAIERVATRLASSDLALSGGARWLRSPSLEEPGAAFADGPALPDPDPAGGVMSPPRAVWAAELRKAPK
jgi:hypothetical protein